MSDQFPYREGLEEAGEKLEKDFKALLRHAQDKTPLLRAEIATILQQVLREHGYEARVLRGIG